MRFTPNCVKLIGILVAAIATAMACGSDDRGLVQTVVYVAEDKGGHLFMLGDDGKEKEVASEAAAAPAWAPDLRRLAYIAARAGENGGELKYWDQDGGGSKSLPESSGKVKSFFWSPDSQMIAYQREAGDGSKSEIRVYDFRDNSNTLVTSGPLGMLELGNWSGDNEWIVMRIETEESPGIFMRSVKGVDEKRLTNKDDSRPRFSPDGKRVAFSRSMNDGSREIYLLTLSDKGEFSSPENISVAAGTEIDFEWSPDGRRIAYVSIRDGNPELYSIDVKDSATVRLTENRVEDSGPRWSRSGSHILFSSNADGDFDIFSMEFKSRSQNRLLDTDGNERAADW